MDGHYKYHLDFVQDAPFLKLLLKHGFSLFVNGSTTLEAILTVFRTLVAALELFDVDNPYIIVLRSDFEDALGVKSLHVTQVQSYIIKQTTNHEHGYSESDLNKQDWCCKGNRPFHIPVWGCDTSKAAQYLIKYNRLLDEPLTPQQLVIPSPGLLKFLRKFPGTRKTQKAFRLRTVFDRLTLYILRNKDSLLDLRNIRLLCTENDILETVFGLKYIYRFNITSLIYNHCFRAKRQGRYIVRA